MVITAMLQNSRLSARYFFRSTLRPYEITRNLKVITDIKKFSTNFGAGLSSSSTRKTMNVFKFSDYDCIGFDLDSTILSYNITNLMHLEYELITDFLIEKKGYNSKIFKKSLVKEDMDFIQKGLVFDFAKGNILKLTPNGNIHKASHGTKMLSEEEIEKYYPNQEWQISKLFCKDPLVAWNGPLSFEIRTILDCFDMSISLVFAKAVDTLDDENGKPLDKYNIWVDILDALAEMYSRTQVQNMAGKFYPALKENPSKYIHKCNPEILAWIKKLKETKKTFLITGSNLDFVEITTRYAIGDDWKSLFDIIVCYAKKPGFFTNNMPFYCLKDCYEDKTLNSDDLEVGGIYNQGNWRELLQFFSRVTGKSFPRCLYVGDNLLQDIYTPSKFTNCDTMVISDEQLAEKMLDHDFTHNHEDILNSNIWGSFFSLKNPDGSYKDSFWNHVIKKYSKICIPKLEMVTNKPMNEPLNCFDQEDNDKTLKGYHPAKPVTTSNLL